MFPIAFATGSIAGRTLKADDIAGISDLYPDGVFNTTDGSLGRVTKDGQLARTSSPLNVATGYGRRLHADRAGQFSIGGLSPGLHIVRVEPIDDADVASFFDVSRNVDIDFRVAYLDRVVVVPRGGDSGEVALKVVRK